MIDNDENQGILILNHFETDAKHMEYIEFADGTTIDLSQGIPFAQTNGNDILMVQMAMIITMEVLEMII